MLQFDVTDSTYSIILLTKIWKNIFMFNNVKENRKYIIVWYTYFNYNLKIINNTNIYVIKWNIIKYIMCFKIWCDD